jgi:hypothetical protein
MDLSNYSQTAPLITGIKELPYEVQLANNAITMMTIFMVLATILYFWNKRPICLFLSVVLLSSISLYGLTNNILCLGLLLISMSLLIIEISNWSIEILKKGKPLISESGVMDGKEKETNQGKEKF